MGKKRTLPATLLTPARASVRPCRACPHAYSDQSEELEYIDKYVLRGCTLDDLDADDGGRLIDGGKCEPWKALEPGSMLRVWMEHTEDLTTLPCRIRWESTIDGDLIVASGVLPCTYCNNIL